MSARYSTAPRISLIAGAVSAAVILAGCAGAAKRHTTATDTKAVTTATEIAPVLRSGRYTLVELSPAQDQRDLLQQVVDVTIPPTAGASVTDGVRYILLQTGYQLCSGNDSTQALDRLPLPAAHIHLGPMTLQNALTILAGDVGELQVNSALREVCFEPPSSGNKP